MIFPVNVHLHDHEDIFQNEFTEIGEVMPFPVFNTSLEVCYCLCVFGSSLRLVDLISDALRSSDAGLEFLDVRVVGITDRLKERLS